ncbi:MAG TPA: alpha/beta hydrolase [Acidimicrobiia bacterium]
MRRSAKVLALAFVTACTTASTSTAPDPSTTAGPTTSPAAVTTTSAIVEGTTAEKLEALGGEPCPDSDFTCVTIAMPLDHFHPDDGRTIDVVFAVLPAAEETEGVFVTATGGPGSSGISVADYYYSLFASSITDSMDVVFFDQRGLALSGGLTCPQAAAVFYRTDALMATAQQEEAYAAAAQAFADDCVAEMGNPEELPYLGTVQALEDLEVFRREMGYDRLVIDGESYGTQFTQAFAAAHPDSVARIVLDGTVDTSMPGLDFLNLQASSFADILDASFDACEQVEECLDDMGGPPGEVYDRLAALLAEGPETVDFPLRTGESVAREFSHADLEIVASAQMYVEDDRMQLNRALAAYGRSGDLVPLARLLYPNAGIDPANESVIDDPSWSDGIYYAVECQDYRFPGEDPAARAEGFFRAADPLDHVRLGSIAVGDLPCAYWPGLDPARADPGYDAAVPTLVLVAEADPATPASGARAVAERLADGHLIVAEGGPHVIFGRGNSCPDDPVTAFIVDGTVPEEGLMCEGVLITDYVPLMPLSVNAFDTPGEMFDAVETELNYLPEYLWWDGVSEDGAGCSGGGAIGFSSDDTSYLFDFQQCGLTDGLVIDGTGSYDPENDVFDLDVSVGDPSCHYTYNRSGDFASFDDECEADPFEG